MLREQRTFWVGATLLAIAVAELLFFGGYRGVIYDSFGYFSLAQRTATRGLFAAAYPSRTYGYPLFIAFCTGFQSVAPETARVLVFHGQLLLFLIVAAFGARWLGQLHRSENFARIAYAAAVGNPFLLARTTEMLSDLVSGVLGYLAVLLTLKRDHPPGRQSPPAAAAASLFLAACAAAVRPAAAALFVAVVLLWIARQAIWRELKPAILPLLLAAGLLPFLPQIAINWRAYRRAEPLLVEKLYREQLDLGMPRLKYATSVRPGEPPQIDYLNPLYRGEKTPGEFFRRRPLAYIATAALHIFAMLDQDFLFSHIRELHPAYRWPLSAANFLFLFLGAVGSVVALRPGQAPAPRDPRRFAAVAFVTAAVASAAVYLPTAVECRFAVPVELLVIPLFAAALLFARECWRQKRWRLLASLGSVGCLFLAGCLALSAWIAAQAPRLR